MNPGLVLIAVAIFLALATVILGEKYGIAPLYFKEKHTKNKRRNLKMEPEIKAVLFGGALIVVGYIAGVFANPATQIAVTGVGTAIATAGLTLKALQTKKEAE